MKNAFQIACISLFAFAACSERPEKSASYRNRNSNYSNSNSESKPDGKVPDLPRSEFAPGGAVAAGDARPEVLSLSFAVNSVADADCPGLQSVSKDINRFSVATESDLMGELIEPGTVSEVIRPCKLKAQVIVPAGYMVEIDLEKPSVDVDFILAEKDTAEFLLRLGSSTSDQSFTRVYTSFVPGPNQKSEDMPLIRVNEVNNFFGENLRNMTCKDSKLVVQQMDISIDFEYFFSADADSPRTAGAFINKLPAFVLKATKCADVVGADNGDDAIVLEESPPAAAEGAKLPVSFTIDEEASKETCSVLKLLNIRKDDNLVEFEIDPINVRVNAAKTLDISSCVISGQVLIPANTVLIPRLTTQNVDTDVKFDKDTSLALRFEVNMFFEDEQVDFISAQTLDGLFSGKRTLELLSEDFNDDCAFAVDRNQTLNFDFLYESVVSQRQPKLAPSTLSILNMPGVAFELKQCP